jgi:hypothetical protein
MSELAVYRRRVANDADAATGDERAVSFEQAIDAEFDRG